MLDYVRTNKHRSSQVGWAIIGQQGETWNESWSFFLKTALTATFFTFATLAAHGQEVTDSAPAPSRERQAEVIAAPAADSEESDQVVASSEQEFSSRHNLPGELALAILLITVCQLVQYSCQSQSPKQTKPHQLQHRAFVIGLGLGSLYQSVNTNNRNNRLVKREIRVTRRKRTAPAKI